MPSDFEAKTLQIFFPCVVLVPLVAFFDLLNFIESDLGYIFFSLSLKKNRLLVTSFLLVAHILIVIRLSKKLKPYSPLNL